MEQLKCDAVTVLLIVETWIMSDSDFDALVSSVASVIQEELLSDEIQKNLRG